MTDKSTEASTRAGAADETSQTQREIIMIWVLLTANAHIWEAPHTLDALKKAIGNVSIEPSKLNAILERAIESYEIFGYPVQFFNSNLRSVGEWSTGDDHPGGNELRAALGL